MEWSIGLTGHQFDLEELPKWLDGGDFQVIEEDGEFLIRSSRFDALSDAEEVRRAAEEVVELLNGLGRLLWPEFTPVAVGAVYTTAEDGRKNVHVFMSDTVAFRGKLKVTVIKRDGSLEQPQDLGRLNSWLDVAETDEFVQRALAYLNRERITWNDLYRALEVVESDVGGRVSKAGWASKAELERFNRTANSYSVLGRAARHGRDRGEPPPNPMKFEEAGHLVRRVVHLWIQEKVDDQHS